MILRLILCSKEKNEYVVRYNMGQMVNPYYPILTNMTFIKVDTKFHNLINDYWDELYFDVDMVSGIENELDIGNGSGDGLLKDIINVYLSIDNHHNAEILKQKIGEFKNLFDKYKISIPSFKKLYKASLSNTSKENIKRTLIEFISDINNLSINDEKINLRDKEKTIKPIENDLKQVKRKKQREAR